MDINFILDQMNCHAETIKSLVLGISTKQACWKPGEESWSILEVVNHLLDEEREDFRMRLDWILHKHDHSWPPINPQGWVKERGYNQRDHIASVNDLLMERQKSLIWLKGLENPDWDIFIDMSFGRISAGDMLSAWVAHDLLHLRQLTELHWSFLLETSKPYRIDYAGEW